MTHRHLRRIVAIVFAFALAVPAFVSAQGGAKPTLDITLTSKPSPPKTGDNAFEVVVKDLSGKPVTDADVSVQLYMAAMPAMKMPEMRNAVALKHAKDGVYTGTGKVMMAGGWDATVSVKRAGKEIGSKKFPITAK
jgi:hypothetical protein